MPHIASEPSSHAASPGRTPTAPPGAVDRGPSSGTFENLLDSANSLEPTQTADPAENAPQPPDKSTDNVPIESRPPAVDHTAGKPIAAQNGSTGKTKKNAGKSGPSDQNKTDDKSDKATDDPGKAAAQPASTLPATTVVAGAAPVSQPGAGAAPATHSTGAAADDKIKAALTAPPAFQAAHGSTSAVKTMNGAHQIALAGAPPSSAPAAIALSGRPQPAGIESKATDDQVDDASGTDAKAPATEHTGSRDAAHQLMAVNAVDANKNNPNSANGGTTATQPSTPLPPTSLAQTSAPTTLATPPQAATPTPPAVPVPLAGVPITIAGKALAGKNHFEIRLDPPELGRIDVRLDVDKDGHITSHVIADRKDTLALLQRDASGLQRALQDAGLKTAGNGLQFSLRDQSGDSSARRQPNSGSLRKQAVLAVDTTATNNAAPRGYRRFLSRTGGIDIRV